MVIIQMGDEIFIKNKLRDVRNEIAKTPYEPEYQRLKRDPIVVPVKKDDFMNQNLNKRSRKVAVNSGQNEETLWNKDPVNSTNQPNSRQYNSYYDDIEDDLNEQNNIENNQETIENKKESPVQTVEIGNYLVFYNESIIFMGTIDDASSIIEELLLNNSGEYILDNFSVFKKMNITTGVLISDE